METSIALAEREKKELQVLFLDFDNFKQVNDKYGHSVGDILLEHLAKTLKTSCRAYDITARLGGDEFAIVLVGATSDVAKKYAEKSF